MMVRLTNWQHFHQMALRVVKKAEIFWQKKHVTPTHTHTFDGHTHYDTHITVTVMSQTSQENLHEIVCDNMIWYTKFDA